jgi:hypothetical protein
MKRMATLPCLALQKGGLIFHQSVFVPSVADHDDQTEKSGPPLLL